MLNNDVERLVKDANARQHGSLGSNPEDVKASIRQLLSYWNSRLINDGTEPKPWGTPNPIPGYTPVPTMTQEEFLRMDDKTRKYLEMIGADDSGVVYRYIDPESIRHATPIRHGMNVKKQKK